MENSNTVCTAAEMYSDSWSKPLILRAVKNAADWISLGMFLKMHRNTVAKSAGVKLGGSMNNDLMYGVKMFLLAEVILPEG